MFQKDLKQKILYKYIYVYIYFIYIYIYTGSKLLKRFWYVVMRDLLRQIVLKDYFFMDDFKVIVSYNWGSN